MKDLVEIRKELDAVDAQLVALFEKRMLLARDVAAYKIANDLPVLDASREDAVLDSRAAMLRDAHFAPALRSLYQEIMRLSREEQQRIREEVAAHA